MKSFTPNTMSEEKSFGFAFSKEEPKVEEVKAEEPKAEVPKKKAKKAAPKKEAPQVLYGAAKLRAKRGRG